VKKLSEMWPIFLAWVNEYAGTESSAASASYSREDMRYAFQAGYEYAIGQNTAKPKPFTTHTAQICRIDCVGTDKGKIGLETKST